MVKIEMMGSERQNQRLECNVTMAIAARMTCHVFGHDGTDDDVTRIKYSVTYGDPRTGWLHK